MADLTHLLKDHEHFLLFRVGPYVGQKRGDIVRRKRIEAKFCEGHKAYWVTTITPEIEKAILEHTQSPTEGRIPIVLVAGEGHDPGNVVVWLGTPGGAIATGPKGTRNALLIEFREECIGDSQVGYSITPHGYSRCGSERFFELWKYDGQSGSLKQNCYGIGFVTGIATRTGCARIPDNYGERVARCLEPTEDEVVFENLKKLHKELIRQVSP